MQVPKILENLNHAPIRRDVNYTKIPVTSFNFSEDGVEKFNQIYFELKEACKDWNKIVRTPSGGISIERRNFRPPMWDVQNLKSTVEITIVGFFNMWRIQVRTSLGNKLGEPRYGRQSFRTFKSICESFGVNLESFAIENGEEVKKEIPKVPIKLERPTFAYKVYEGVHHIDLNSSFVAGMAESYPELRKPIEYMYSMRKQIPEYKQDLVATQGFMQSKIINYRFAHLSKAGIESNNRKIEKIANNLREQGFIILLYNTDGIWYIGHDRQYHDENEGRALGQWKHDHINCKFRAVSKGAYEFIENGKINVVLRGITKLDKIKDRENWEWGDICRLDAIPFKYEFYENKGVVRVEEDPII